jgi:pimeloyl-ACP methyl ester carboxylesterase
MLEVEHYGTGRPLVLIHGSPANGKTWRAVGERLAGRYHIVAPTLPGHEIDAGDRPPVAMGTADMAEAIEGAIGGFDEPVRLAAHSFGANVALALAIRGRLAIERMILFEPVTMRVLPLVGEDAAYAEARAAFDGYLERYRRGDSRAVETMIAFWFGPGAFDRMPEPVQTYLIERTEVNVRDVDANFGEVYSRDGLSSLRLPTTIVCGGASPEIIHRIAQATTLALGNASMEIIDGATHGMLSTHPEVVANKIGDMGRSDAD